MTTERTQRLQAWGWPTAQPGDTPTPESQRNRWGTQRPPEEPWPETSAGERLPGAPWTGCCASPGRGMDVQREGGSQISLPITSFEAFYYKCPPCQDYCKVSIFSGVLTIRHLWVKTRKMVSLADRLILVTLQSLPQSWSRNRLNLY